MRQQFNFRNKTKYMPKIDINRFSDNLNKKLNTL